MQEEFHSPQINELELKSPWVRKLIRADRGRGPELPPFPGCGLCQHKAVGTEPVKHLSKYLTSSIQTEVSIGSYKCLESLKFVFKCLIGLGIVQFRVGGRR